ncbi:hypothetical protein RvY_07718 [Ramazzottius varieornatus]|uniref:Peptidase C1A papain C-terminal domain-containing protein n=1 Tax=Ramazzottius varieornatus TaxID=947166 RepID=A0A1D1V990_RAMVA|nr:hypothetical protein RvY_07718 [Ramazzottius varieornatus]
MDWMHAAICLLVIFLGCYASDDSWIARYVNSLPGATWRATIGDQPHNATQKAFRPSAVASSTFILQDHEMDSFPQQPLSRFAAKLLIPESFDARENWPQCESMKEIRDQGGCGSCWAHAVSEVLSDRLCIFSKTGFSYIHMSVQDLISCCRKCGSCNGGVVEYAFEHFKTFGFVTGGDYASRKGCKAYQFSPDTWNETIRVVPKCKRSCYPGYRKTYASDLHKGTSWYVVSKLKVTAALPKDRREIEESERKIQRELMTNGPVTCSLQVYEDLKTYESGVYQHYVGNHTGAHATKIIGWGYDKNLDVPYWTVANSWGPAWGEKGFVRVRRGANECGIESRINAAIPRSY